MFADEARFGRMNRPRPCWAPDGTRPQVACQLVREYVYLYGAVSPKAGTCVYRIMPAPDTQCFQIFLETLAKKYPRMSARPRAARATAPTGLTLGKPEPQLDSSGSPAHQPMSATAPIATATKPAAWLARFLLRSPAWPTNSVT